MFVLWLLLPSVVAALRKCPQKTPGLRSGPSDTEVRLDLKNTLSREVAVHWLSVTGTEGDPTSIDSRGDGAILSFAGHCFRVRLAVTGDVVDEFCIPKEFSKPGNPRHSRSFFECDGLPPEDRSLFPAGRDKEFEALLQEPTKPCSPADDSSKWSCLRYLRPSEVGRRDSSLFGFTAEEVRNDRDIGSGVCGTVDTRYTKHIRKMPKITSGPGYLILNFTTKMRELALEWFDKHRSSITFHERISGGYTNIKSVPMKKLDLDQFSAQREKIVAEMRQILQWWTGQELVHTSTFGARVYSRGSMLVDHVDRSDTHIVSAVLQLDQDVDQDGGWPLELLLPNASTAEVYVQRGQMILYEGGWLRHGRPMRFRGTSFSNIFSHFKPVDWSGPTEQSANTYAGVPKDRTSTIADAPLQIYSCRGEDVSKLLDHEEL